MGVVMKYTYLFSIIFILSFQAEAVTFKAPKTSEIKVPIQIEKPSVKNWAVKTAPVAYIAKWVTVDVTRKLTSKLSMGPSLIYYGNESSIGNMFLPTYRGYAAGYNMNYFFKGLHQTGWYMSHHSYYEDYKDYPHNSDFTFSNEGWRADLIGGWNHKFPKYPVFIQSGLGLQYQSYDQTERQNSRKRNQARGIPNREVKENGFSPTLESKVGVHF